MRKNTEEKFKKILKEQGMESLDKPTAYYVVRYHDPSLPEGQSFIYQQFKTKAERNKWYKDSGEEIARVHGGFLEMPEEPVSEEDIKKEKSG